MSVFHHNTQPSIRGSREGTALGAAVGDVYKLLPNAFTKDKFGPAEGLGAFVFFLFPGRAFVVSTAKFGEVFLGDEVCLLRLSVSDMSWGVSHSEIALGAVYGLVPL